MNSLVAAGLIDIGEFAPLDGFDGPVPGAREGAAPGPTPASGLARFASNSLAS
jgi:hypothetical protein